MDILRLKAPSITVTESGSGRHKNIKLTYDCEPGGIYHFKPTVKTKLYMSTNLSTKNELRPLWSISIPRKGQK